MHLNPGESILEKMPYRTVRVTSGLQVQNDTCKWATSALLSNSPERKSSSEKRHGEKKPLGEELTYRRVAEEEECGSEKRLGE